MKLDCSSEPSYHLLVVVQYMHKPMDLHFSHPDVFVNHIQVTIIIIPSLPDKYIATTVLKKLDGIRKQYCGITTVHLAF